MQTVIQGTVIGATRYQIEDGNKGGTLYLMQPTSGRNPNVVGFEVLKMKMPYELFEKLQGMQQDGHKFPGDYEVLADIERGAQDKVSMTVLSIKGGALPGKAEPSPAGPAADKK